VTPVSVPPTNATATMDTAAVGKERRERGERDWGGRGGCWDGRGRGRGRGREREREGGSGEVRRRQSEQSA